MKRQTRTLVNFALGTGIAIGSEQCTGTQCTGTNGCRQTPKWGGSAYYENKPRGVCEWTIWPYGTCVEHAGLTCLKKKHYYNIDCSGILDSTTVITVTGC
ncbi:MAG: hypothetical protein C4320_05010 [Armatimonadota bacterium]